MYSLKVATQPLRRVEAVAAALLSTCGDGGDMRLVLTRHGELDADDVELVVDLGRGVTWAFAGALAAVLNEIKK